VGVVSPRHVDVDVAGGARGGKIWVRREASDKLVHFPISPAAGVATSPKR
jgi:hypothetical protein